MTIIKPECVLVKSAGVYKNVVFGHLFYVTLSP